MAGWRAGRCVWDGMPYPMYSDIFAVCCEGRKGVVEVSVWVVGAVSREMARVAVLMLVTTSRAPPAASVRRSPAKRLAVSGLEVILATSYDV